MIYLPRHINEVNHEQSCKNSLRFPNCGFLVGYPYRAALEKQKGRKIIAGVIDRKFTPNLKWPVSNGRQAYFPLSDGTWLGLKGSGDFRNIQDLKSLSAGEDIHTWSYDDNRGLVLDTEVVNAVEARRIA